VRVRRLCLILGDQLDRESSLFRQFDPRRDRLWMAEVREESTHVWSHKQRIALFLAAMRHFAAELTERGWPLDYQRLAEHEDPDLGSALARSLRRWQPQQVRLVMPGDYRVLQQIRGTCSELRTPLEILEDDHFLSTPDEFRRWAAQRKQLRLEYWYRQLRQRHAILLEADGRPAGGEWNFDADNRCAFPKSGPGGLPSAPRFSPSRITREVIELVNREFNGHPGRLDRLDWPVTPVQAEQLVRRFLDHALPHFGRYQDACWSDQPFLFHSLLSSSLNLKLIRPEPVLRAAEACYRDGSAPIDAVEGFIRQVLGWREYVRGLYWLHMPKWLNWNALASEEELPGFYWSGDTELNCLRQSIGQVMQHGYAHHIQRLMISGLFALLFGVRPDRVHEWFLATHVDAVEWVELPNTIGMGQYADNGVMASKPYIASGNYIQRMTNYCRGCRYDPKLASGPQACPFTLLYYDFLYRHEERFRQHPRMKLMLRNAARKSREEQIAIQQQAEDFRQQLRENIH